MAGGSTVLVIVTSALAGYAFSRFDFRGRRLLMFGILMTRIIPVSATIAPLYLIVQWLKMIDTYQGLILVLAAQQLPLAIWLMKGFFDTVPGELEEAAWVDGASPPGQRIPDRPAPRGPGRRRRRAVRVHRIVGRLPDPADPDHVVGQDTDLDRPVPGVQLPEHGRLGAARGHLGGLHGPDDHPVPPGPPLPDQGDRGRRDPGRRLSRGAGRPMDLGLFTDSVPEVVVRGRPGPCRRHRRDRHRDRRRRDLRDDPRRHRDPARGSGGTVAVP